MNIQWQVTGGSHVTQPVSCAVDAAQDRVRALRVSWLRRSTRLSPPVIPDGASIMEQFKIAAGHMLKILETNPKMVTGVVNMIRPDGSQPALTGFTVTRPSACHGA
jgi:hypothetical protein